MVREMVSGVLLDAGYRIEHASDGIEALAKAAERSPKVMIIDVGLPGIYGFELCERLKSEHATSGIKIILLASVYGITRYKRKPTSLYGADDYIEKHHIADSLVPKINSLLQDKGPAGVPAPAAGHDHHESAVPPPPPVRRRAGTGRSFSGRRALPWTRETGREQGKRPHP
jgi:DNA-binding response OmpR family regulator